MLEPLSALEGADMSERQSQYCAKAWQFQGVKKPEFAAGVRWCRECRLWWCELAEVAITSAIGQIRIQFRSELASRRQT